MNTPRIPDDTKSKLRIFGPGLRQAVVDVGARCVGCKLLESVENGGVRRVKGFGRVSGIRLVRGGLQSVNKRILELRLRRRGGRRSDLFGDGEERIQEVGIVELGKRGKGDVLRRSEQSRGGDHFETVLRVVMNAFLERYPGSFIEQGAPSHEGHSSVAAPPRASQRLQRTSAIMNDLIVSRMESSWSHD